MDITYRNIDKSTIKASTLIPLVHGVFSQLAIPGNPDWKIFIHGLFAEQTDRAQITCSAGSTGSPIPGTPPFDAHEYAFPLYTKDPPTLDRIKDELRSFSHLLMKLSSGK